MKKILHVITGLGDGGAEGVMFRLICSANQYEHVVISLTGMGKYGQLLESDCYKVHCLNLRNIGSIPAAFLKLIMLVKKEQPWIVQTWMYHSDFLGGVAARLAGADKVFWGVRHSDLVFGKSKCSTIIISRLCALFSYVVPDKVVYCARSSAKTHSSVGYSKKKSVVINNGYDCQFFSPDHTSSVEVRKQLQAGDDDFLIGMVGRYNPQKDHDNLLQSLGFVKRRFNNFKCVLVGEDINDGNSELKDRIDELGLSDNISMIGTRSDIQKIMNALDIHVSSSLYGEGFPNVVAEAMACGTPCIVTDVGESGNIVGGHGWVVAPGNPEALSQAILSAISEKLYQPHKWEKRKQESVVRIREKFSLDKMVSEFCYLWS